MFQQPFRSKAQSIAQFKNYEVSIDATKFYFGSTNNDKMFKVYPDFFGLFDILFKI